MKRILSFLFVSFAIFVAFAQAPPNYYSTAAGLTGSALKTQLSVIITNGHQQKTYDDLWTAYATTDRDYDYENDGTILDIYSENPTGPDHYNFGYPGIRCGSYVNEGDCYNREHVVPQSLFNQALPMKSDVNFIRATDGKINGMRSNYPYGKVGITPSSTSENGSKLGNSVSPGYSGIVFEPIDAFKGDVARMIFYFVTRYESKLATFSSGNMLGGTPFPGLQNWELIQLLEWNALDPVSPAEIRRNNASFVFQGNRNPFIDNPAYADQIWGTPVIDTQAPTAATNLFANNPTSNSIALTWTAATDNIGVTSYDIYANGALKTTVLGTLASTVVTGLSSSTLYNLYIIARDASGNSSPVSNTATETTLQGQSGGNTSCGTENFDSIVGTDNGYSTRTWTNNNITWSATDTKIDEKINSTRAITIRSGQLISSTVSGGVQTLTLTTQRRFSGADGSFNVFINNVLVGSIPYTQTAVTTTINANVSGDVVIKLVNTSSNRATMDDLSWTCFSSLGTSDVNKDKSAFVVYPNPVKNNELFVKGDNISKITKAEIYDFSGKLIEVIVSPFKNSNKINLKGLIKGNYILKTDAFSTKFIVE